MEYLDEGDGDYCVRTVCQFLHRKKKNLIKFNENCSTFFGSLVDGPVKVSDLVLKFTPRIAWRVSM